jgi:hypothetical protein
MINTVQINENILQEALALSDNLNTKSLIETALLEYIQRRKQLKIIELFGNIDYEENYDYQEQRKKRFSH